MKRIDLFRPIGKPLYDGDDATEDAAILLEALVEMNCYLVKMGVRFLYEEN